MRGERKNPGRCDDNLNASTCTQRTKAQPVLGAAVEVISVIPVHYVALGECARE